MLIQKPWLMGIWSYSSLSFQVKPPGFIATVVLSSLKQLYLSILSVYPRILPPSPSILLAPLRYPLLPVSSSAPVG